MSRTAQQRAAIRRLTATLAAAAPIDFVQQVGVEEACRLTEAASAALCLFVEGDEMLDFAAVAGEHAEQIVGLRVRVADSLSETVVKTSQPTLIDARTAIETGDLFTSDSTPPALPPPRPAQGPLTTRSAAIVPVLQEGRLIGTLSALNKLPQGGATVSAFDAEDLDTLALIAELIALAGAQQKTARTAREQARELSVLYDAARTVAGSLNIQEVMDNVLAAICMHLEHHAAVLFLLNDERTHLFIAAERGLTHEEREIQLAVDAGLPARVLDTGLSRLILDTDLESDFEDLSPPSRALSAMLAPIRSRDETHGLILVTSLQRHAYHHDDLKLLTAVGTQAGIAIENALLYESAQRQAEEASALYDLSQHVNSTLHLDRVLDFVAESVLNLLKVDKFALMLYDAKQNRLVTRLSRHVDETLFNTIQPRVGEGIAGWVYEWQTPQAVADVVADARNRSAPIDPAGVASTLCVPMHVNEDVIGVIHAMSSKRRLFTVAEMELLYTIANQAAVSIVNAMLYRDARSKSHEMRRYFRRVAQAIGDAFDEQDLPRLLADLAVEIMRADRCTIYRIEPEGLRLQAASRFRTAVPPDLLVPLGQGLCGWVARRGQSLVLTDLDADPRSRAHPWLGRDRQSSYLAVPLKAGRRTVGVAEIYSQEPREFTREEVRLLSTFTRRAKVAEKIAMDPAP